MKLYPDPEETIDGVGRALRSGERTCVDVLDACLAKIDAWEPKVRAWVVVDREGALAQARRLDEELAAGKCRGLLHGIPIGIKDIIDVEGLPTACGYRPWSDRIAEKDARIVERLRDHGAVILGKTVTTQFAWIDPPVTRNPWDLNRTPGGSSSGSAAAVACGMCFGAIGTQTGGSIIRPASFCGVAGAKPFRWFPMHEPGILEFAPSLDHYGPLARTIRDVGVIWVSCHHHKDRDDIYQEDGFAPPERVEKLAAELFDEFDAYSNPPFALPPKLAVLKGFFERRSDPLMWRAFQQATTALAEAGAEVSTMADPLDFEDILHHHRIVMAAEAAAGHVRRYHEAADQYGPKISELLHEGFARSATDYLQSCSHQREQRRTIGACLYQFGGHLLMPATIGPAPSLATTGDPSFNSPWSYTGSCEVSLPIGLSADGLPLALQVIGAHDIEGALKVAHWCEEVIRRAYDSQE